MLEVSLTGIARFAMLRPLSIMANKGFIGLQGALGGIPMHFRNLKIKPIE